MPIVPNFTAEQTSNLSSVTITDTSTGSDTDIASRRVYFKKYNNAYLVPTGTLTDYVEFPLSDGTETTIANLLDKAYALDVTVDWIDVSGNALYSKTLLIGFDAYLKYGLYQLTQYQISNNNLIKQRNYQNSKLSVWDGVLSGNNALIYASDILNAQRCYDSATSIITNPSLFY